MQLVGMMDSPYVRRVAISARLLGLQYEHLSISIFRDYDEFRRLNPLVKVPTLICEDGNVLVDSTLIMDHLESICGRTLMPAAGRQRQAALRQIGVALVAMEKVVQLIYETRERPREQHYGPWIERLRQQLGSALDIMEEEVAGGTEWLHGDEVSQADVSTAVAWRFVQHVFPKVFIAAAYPGLAAFSNRAEALPEFIACPLE